MAIGAEMSAAEAAVAANTATASRGETEEAPRRPSLFGSGRGKTAACTGVIREKSRTSTTSGVIMPSQLAPPTYPAPTAKGLPVLPQQQQQQQQQQHRLSGDEEVGGGLLFSSSAGSAGRSDAGTAAVANVQNVTPLLNQQANHPATTGGEEDLLLLLVAPRSTGSCRRRWIICGRSVVAALNLVWSTATVTVTLIAAFLAILVTLWALSPICTSCVRSTTTRANSASANTEGAAADESGWSTLYINQLQVIGTHNSYHQRTYIPATSDYWDFHYPSLTTQLDAGIRHLELDIHYDWKTGRWFVFHLSVLDPMSSCNCLSACVEEIREWSDAHPTHHILFIELELKLTDFLQLCGQSTPDADHTAFQTMQETVVGAFPRGRILTPREVRGDYDTLTEAITVTAASSHHFDSSSSSSSSKDSSTGGGGSSSSSSGSGSTSSGRGQLHSSSSNGNSSSSGSGSDGDGSAEGGLGPGEGTTVMKGGWPLVDDTRGMVLFVIDYQSFNLHCRPAIRKALPEDETVFFERTPLQEIDRSPLLAFGETRVPYKIDSMARSGVIVRDRIKKNQDWDSRSASEYEDGDEPRSTYIVDTAAQLVVWDDLRVVQPKTSKHHQSDDNDDSDGLPTPLPCRSRCSAIVPEEQCVLEGFC